MINSDELAKRYDAYIMSICTKMLYDKSLARDAAQNVWIEVIKSLPSFNEQSEITTWIYTIAKRTVFRFIKNEKRHSFGFYNRYLQSQTAQSVQSHDNYDISGLVIENCEKCITAALHCLSREARFIYILREILKREHSDIAEICGGSSAKMRKSFQRSSRRIKNFLSKNCALFYPGAECTCSMKKLLSKTELRRELEKAGNTVEAFYEICAKKLK